MRISNKEKTRRMAFAREQAAAAWTRPATSGKVMDVELAEAFAEILCPIMYAPHLGCASTGEIIDELVARLGNCEMSRLLEKAKTELSETVLNYRTVSND